jgi:uncharacterized protein (TIGR03083 family)
MASGTATRSVEELRTALNSCYSVVEALCADLAEAQWQVQSLCPEWTVRGVIDHLTSVEAVLAGWLPEDAAAMPPFERAGEFLAQTAGLHGDQYLDKVRAVYARRRRDLDALSQGDVERPSWTPVGPGTYGKFLAIRVFDFWVHVRDMTTPLGLSTDDTGLAAEMALAEVEGSLSYIVGKKVGLPDGKSIVFHLTGPLAAEYAVAVDGRAKQVERLDNPDVEVSTDSTTFIQLACGRIDPQGPIDARAITWSGDAELGERAARNLRYTM